MEMFRSLVDRVLRAGVRAPTTVVVRHEPSSLFLGEGFTLSDDVSSALQFEGLDAAASFLDRHASEPCYAPFEVDLDELASSAA